MRKLIGIAAVCALAVFFVWFPGCRQYPPVSSKESLDLIKLVYTACNTKSAKRLDVAQKRIDAASRDGKLSPEEEAGFRKILGIAAAGDWRSAEAAAYRFAQDQLGQGK